MKTKAKPYEVAYLCNGKNPACRGRMGCYYAKPANGVIGGCLHTRETKYAKNRVLKDQEHPREYPDRFERFTCGDLVRYYESLRWFD